MAVKALRLGGPPGALFLLACGLLACSTSAPAQQIGSNIKRHEPARMTSNLVDAEVRSRRTLRDFAICTAKRARPQTERYLAQSDPAAAHKLARGLASPECLYHGDLVMSGPLFRGSLFEALYLLDFRKGPVEDLGSVPRIDHISQAPDPASPDARYRGALRNLADCSVRANPQAAHKLILSLPGAAEEAAAFQAIIPQVSSCVVEGLALKFSRPVLRGLVAEALYRLSALRSGRAEVTAG